MERETCGEEHDPQTEFTVTAGEPLAHLPARPRQAPGHSLSRPAVRGLWLHLHPSGTPLQTGCGKETSLHGPLPVPPMSFSCCFSRPKPQTQPRPCSMNSNGNDSDRNPSITSHLGSSHVPGEGLHTHLIL